MQAYEIRQATSADCDDVCKLAFALFSELFPGSYAYDRFDL